MLYCVRRTERENGILTEERAENRAQFNVRGWIVRHSSYKMNETLSNGNKRHDNNRGLLYRRLPEIADACDLCLEHSLPVLQLFCWAYLFFFSLKSIKFVTIKTIFIIFYLVLNDIRVYLPYRLHCRNDSRMLGVRFTANSLRILYPTISYPINII